MEKTKNNEKRIAFENISTWLILPVSDFLLQAQEVAWRGEVAPAESEDAAAFSSKVVSMRFPDEVTDSVGLPREAIALVAKMRTRVARPWELIVPNEKAMGCFKVLSTAGLGLLWSALESFR